MELKGEYGSISMERRTINDTKHISKVDKMKLNSIVDCIEEINLECHFCDGIPPKIIIDNKVSKFDFCEIAIELYYESIDIIFSYGIDCDMGTKAIIEHYAAMYNWRKSREYGYHIVLNFDTGNGSIELRSTYYEGHKCKLKKNTFWNSFDHALNEAELVYFSLEDILKGKLNEEDLVG